MQELLDISGVDANTLIQFYDSVSSLISIAKILPGKKTDSLKVENEA